MNATVRNASCFMYTKKAKHCRDDVGNQYVFADKNKFEENQIKIHQLHIFKKPRKISSECMSLLFKLFCHWFFPLCDVTSHKPQPRSTCRESCDFVVNRICKDASRALMKLADGGHQDVLDINAINCSLYETGNSGNISECYQISDLPGRLIFLISIMYSQLIYCTSHYFIFLESSNLSCDKISTAGLKSIVIDPYASNTSALEEC